MLLHIVQHQPQMLGAIVRGTPAWVWAMLASLATLGLSQARARQASLARVSLMPLGMTAFAAAGTVTAFGGAPTLLPVLLAWVIAAGACLALLAPRAAPAGTRYDSATRRFTLPGSWTPLALILGVFLVKYVVGVELALQPALAADPVFSVSVAALYGAISGVFIGRAAALLRLARRPDPRPDPRTTPARPGLTA